MVDPWAGSLTLHGQPHTRSAIPPTMSHSVLLIPGAKSSSIYLQGGQNGTDGVKNVLVSILYPPTQADSDRQQPAVCLLWSIKEGLTLPLIPSCEHQTSLF